MAQLYKNAASAGALNMLCKPWQKDKPTCCMLPSEATARPERALISTRYLQTSLCQDAQQQESK